MEKIQRPGNTHSIFTTSMSIVKVLPCSSIIQCFQDFDLSILQAQNRYSKAHFGCMYQMYLNDSRVHSFISQDDKRVLFILEKCWARNAVFVFLTHLYRLLYAHSSKNKWPCLHWYFIIHLFSCFTLTFRLTVSYFFE